MANPFYTHSSAAPVSQTRGTSSTIRLELDLIAAGFDVVANSVLGVGVESGTLNNFLLTLNPLPTAYPSAGTFTFIATHANTGAATFQLGALTAIPLLANDGTALTNNYIVVGEIVQVFTNGTNAYVMGATKSYVDATAFSGVLPAQGGNTGKLLVTNGATAFWSSSILLASLGAGTVAAPSLNFGDAGTGLYRPALNQIAQAINGVISELTQAAGKTFYGSTTFGTGIVFPANMTSPQLLALTGAPSATGGGASGTWGISISGNAASASVLSTSLASNGIAASGNNIDILSASIIPGYLFGCILSTAGASATMSIAAGKAQDSTGVQLMTLAAIAKTTASWAVGTAAGGLDTSTILANTTYHFYVIRRPDTGVVDVVFSLSATGPTLPTSYTQFRRIGSMKTNASSQWTPFIQDGDLFSLLTTVEDVATAAPGVASVTRTLASIPAGIRVRGLFSAQIRSVTTGAVIVGRLSDLAAVDEGISNDGTTPANFFYVAAVAGMASGAEVQVMTNTAQQVRTIISFSDANVVLRIRTMGWIDTRGRNA